MQVRLEENMQLVITPESYVEHVALMAWCKNKKSLQRILIEAYTKPEHVPSCKCHLPQVHGHEVTCPEYRI